MKTDNQIQHSLEMFLESLGSKHTQKKYEYLIGCFRDYYHFKDYDSIIQVDKSELQKMVEAYVINLKKRLNPNTVPTHVNPIKTFLEINDIDLNWRKIKRLFPTKIKRSGSTAYTTDEVKRMLDVTPQLRNRAIIHFLASTGIRVGATEYIQLRHLRDMPLGCKSVLVYEDSTEEYHTFLTPEATKALDLYLDQRRKDGELLNENSPVFRTTYRLGSQKVASMGSSSIQMVVNRAVSNASIRGQSKGNRYSTQLNHGFRKRFNTILKMNKEVNDNAIEKMMGHQNGLDGTYLRLTVDELFKEFTKGILDLSINQEEKQKIQIEVLSKEHDDLVELKKENSELKEQTRELINEEISKVMKLQDAKLIRELDLENDRLRKEIEELKNKK